MEILYERNRYTDRKIYCGSERESYCESKIDRNRWERFTVNRQTEVFDDRNSNMN
jgi:hypothetical protein